MELKKVLLDDIKPYENNPRINDAAVASVKESINQCGYIAPIVVDENMVILAGHTRFKALAELGYHECNILMKDGLSEEQKRKYRILDNKTNELAEWDFTKLEEELNGLDFDGFDFGFNIPDDDIWGVDEKLNDYKEPEKKKLKCPCCGHIDSAERFLIVHEGVTSDEQNLFE